MEWVAGNIFIRPNIFEKAGDKIDGHTHNFDHVSIFHNGLFHIKAKGPLGQIVEDDIDATKTFQHRLIKKDWEHEITAKTDNCSFWCVFAHRTPQGDVIQENNGWLTAYE